MNAFFVLLALVLIALLVPMKYDPTIRIREWLERRNRTHQ